MLYITHLNKDNTISVKNSFNGELRHLTESQVREAAVPILGVFRLGNKVEVHPVQADSLSQPLMTVVNKINNPQIKEFANLCRRVIPPYFFSAPASLSGKYHPASDLGDGGLVRHTIFVCDMLLRMTFIESTRQMLNLTDTEIDLMLVACMMHDSLKSGWGNNPNEYPEHPINAANLIRGMAGFLDAKYLNFIANCIETHMGQWQEPKPSNKYQWLVHLADFLASRRELSLVYNNTVYVRPDENVVHVEITGSTKMTSYESRKLQEAQQKLIDGYIISDKEREKFGISADRNQETIINIMRNIIKYNSYTEKQKKYYNLGMGLVSK